MYYNDSIGSSPTRTIATLRSFDKKVILIAGGYDKKLPFDTLAQEIAKRCSAVFLTGATRNKINDALKAANVDVYTEIVEKFDDAVTCASRYAKDGDIVLLSPACASFDSFKNFEVRGDKFIEIVNSL
jgi:UDP-N-acetylmuramoylalanine--D-glutamate ligase